MNELKLQLDLLTKRVIDLENENKKLKAFSSISYEIETSFLNRGFLGASMIETPASFAVAGAGQNREIAISGDPQTITVLDYPYSYIKLKNLSLNSREAENLGGSFFYIPLYTT